MCSEVHDVITGNKFHQNQLRGFRATAVRKLGSPTDLAYSPYNRPALPCWLWLNQLVYENDRVITILPRKWCHGNKHLAELAPHRGGKTAGIDNCVKKSRHCHSLYTTRRFSAKSLRRPSTCDDTCVTCLLRTRLWLSMTRTRKRRRRQLGHGTACVDEAERCNRRSLWWAAADKRNPSLNLIAALPTDQLSHSSFFAWWTTLVSLCALRSYTCLCCY